MRIADSPFLTREGCSHERPCAVRGRDLDVLYKIIDISDMILVKELA